VAVTVDQPNAHTALVTLDRPERLNALDHEHLAALHDELARIDADGDVRVVVLTGAGRAFCAGMDLRNPGVPPGAAGLGPVQYFVAFQRHFATLVRRIRSLRAVVIAAVNGHASGAGMALTLAADLRVAGPEATFTVANIKVGLSGCDVGLSYHLPRAIGTTRAAELMLTGRSVGAEEAERIGLVLRVTDDVVADALALADEVGRHTPFGLAMTKEVMWANVDAGSLDAALMLEDRTQVLASLTDDHKEAVAAFREKRAPEFRNR
jgi:enoyl-CoA hydratase